MQNNILVLLPLLAPLILILYSLALFLNQKKQVEIKAEAFGLAGIILSGISAWVVYDNGAIQSSIVGWSELGFAIRLDALSVSMLTMIALLGFAILKFSKNYLDGDPRKRVFFCRLAITIASVELLILSGNLFQILVLWIITSVCLHYLLVFYRTRPQAIAAARKKFIVARLGDVALAGATALIYMSLGTGDLDKIFIAVQDTGALNASLTWATVLLVITAVLKSAQFPTHGWLIEVVETPTPVSALLHAGLLNAGPFLMVRMGFLLSESTPASLMLIAIGGFTALFASVVFLTQPTVKVALGYSSIAHMGFSLMICGFGVYSAAILHVVAHSFYKAHSFLSSGSVIDSVKARRINLPARTGSIGRISLSILSALAVYILFCYWWGLDLKTDFNLIALGSIIVMGLSQLLVTTLDSKGSIKAVIQSVGLVFLVSLAFFSLEHGSREILTTELPTLGEPNWIVKSAILFLITCYAIIIGLQLLAPKLKTTGFSHRLGIHIRNGFYANVIFDRMIGSLKHEKFKWANLSVQEEQQASIEPEEIVSNESEIVLNS